MHNWINYSVFFLFMLLSRSSVSLVNKVSISSAKMSRRFLTKGSKNKNTNLSAVDKQKQEYFNRPGPWDEKDLGSLLKANKMWTNRMVQQNPDFFEYNKLGHSPKILWIGCSDARVPANLIIGEPPGSIFVHRNIANMVVNTDVNCMSVIQYAVDVLRVKHIIVCGHYDCGGVKASLENIDHTAPLENWLRNIRDTVRLHMDELMTISDPVDRQRKLVEINTIEQCLNIFKTAVVQRRRVETKALIDSGSDEFEFVEPRVHAFVYEPTTGEANKLEVDFKKYLSDLDSVYGIYNMNDVSPPVTDNESEGNDSGGSGKDSPKDAIDKVMNTGPLG